MPLGFTDPSSTPPPEPADPAQNTDGQELVEAGTGEDVGALLQTILPWSISILLHVIVVILAIYVVWSVKIDGDEDMVIPVARLSPTPDTPLKMQVLKTTMERTRLARSVSQSQIKVNASISDQTDTPPKLIGTLGAIDSAMTNPFGMSKPSGLDLAARLFNIGGNARRIVYVIDASGSLVDSLDFVINELKRSINELNRQQLFTVIFFQGNKPPLEVPPPGLRDATTERKQRVIKWIDPDSGNITAGGGTNPIEAIKLGLRYRPQLMILLSDNITGRGIYEVDQKQLLKAIKQANRAQTKISTIQFLYPDPLEGNGRQGTMELVAGQNGGQYRFVDARELGLE